MTRGERLIDIMNECKLDALAVGGVKNTIALSAVPFPDELWFEMLHGLDPSVIILSPAGKSFMSSCRAFNLDSFPMERDDCEMLPEVVWKTIVDGIRKRGLDRGRIGIDVGHAPAGLLAALRDDLPDAEFVDAETVLMRVRAVKTPEEIANMQRAIEIGEAAFESIQGTIKDGDSFSDIIRPMAKKIIDLGGVPHIIHPYELHCPDWRGESPAVDGLVRSPVTVKAGETTRLDVCINYRGYYSDYKLPVCLGEPSEYAKSVVERHVRRLEFMYATVRPGITKRELNDACVKEFTDVDEFDWWLHGVGLDYHEEPRIGSRYPTSPDVRSEVIFEESNALALEPSWLVEEHTILEKDGPRRLNSLNTRTINPL